MISRISRISGADRAATIKTVAKRAGVATSTVARVLNENGYVAEETRLRVMQAVGETGYQINAIARGLKRGRSNVVGHLLQSTVPNPFFVKVARGVEAFAEANGYTVLTYNVQGDVDAERRGVETFLGWRVDAMIFTTPMAADNVDLAIAAGIPVAQVERPRSDHGLCLTVDNYVGAREAMRHLIELGHRRIAYVGQKPGSLGNAFADYVEEERFAAYRDIMREAGHLDEALIAFGPAYTLADLDAHGIGYRAAHDWLGRKLNLTAIFASSDLLAAGVLQAISEHGMLAPRDVSVVGFDDTLAPFLAPSLTSVHMPAHELGEAAARRVMARLSDGGQEENAVRLRTRLVVRGSTGPVLQRGK
jgi:DNA-binding LacI/PurR family transcriptional regulator